MTDSESSANYFDRMAKDWDENEEHVKRAQKIADDIIAILKTDQALKGFEYGSGTGLLSFLLKDHFSSITMADSSEGMLAVMKEKLAKQGISNLHPLKADLVNDSIEEKDYDVLFTSMTLHHVLDVDNMLHVFHDMLKPGGLLFIADLEKEDGSFHSHLPDFVGHNGFDRNELEAMLNKNGFKVELYKVCLEMTREIAGDNKTFNVFLMVGVKG